MARALSEGRSDLRVLEVGAGIGSTTRQLLPALEGRLALYRFTDVSTLFLDDARTLFADTSHVDYALLDINRPVDFDQHPAQGYDLIFAGQVMHDASHVVRTLRRLGMLLKPGGRLMLTEATERDSALQMASVGFIEAWSAIRTRALWTTSRCSTCRCGAAPWSRPASASNWHGRSRRPRRCAST
ncbi:class I SAM-dependent methyltransferase [Xanthomonas hortorum pv. pelargonii]|nr:class I SAM-dependent methyltransferase [Xanthomonas hortorum pv. pelargonii]